MFVRIHLRKNKTKNKKNKKQNKTKNKQETNKKQKLFSNNKYDHPQIRNWDKK